MKTREFKTFCNERISIASHLTEALRGYLLQAIASILAVKANEGKPNMVYLRNGKLISNPYSDDEFYKNLSRLRYDKESYSDVKVHFRPYNITEDNKTSEDVCAIYYLSNDELKMILDDTTDKDRVAFMNDEEFAEFNNKQSVNE